jgi:hypothetical protein
MIVMIINPKQPKSLGSSNILNNFFTCSSCTDFLNYPALTALQGLPQTRYNFLHRYGFLYRYGFLHRALATLAANDTAAWRSGGFQ